MMQPSNMYWYDMIQNRQSTAAGNTFTQYIDSDYELVAEEPTTEVFKSSFQ